MKYGRNEKLYIFLENTIYVPSRPNLNIVGNIRYNVLFLNVTHAQ